jgi:acetylornithine deacetylase
MFVSRADDFSVEPLDPIRLTRELCEIESTTYHEGALGDFLANYLVMRGWSVEKTPVPQPPESADAGERWNIYAGKADEKPDVVFSTHMDTVPPYIQFSEDEDFLYGRGVCDAKGILAAQLACCLSVARSATRPGPRLPT